MYPNTVVSIKNSPQVLRRACIKCGQCFLHFFIHISLTIEIASILDPIEHIANNQSHAFYSSQFSSGTRTFHQLANMASMSNMPSTDDATKTVF